MIPARERLSTFTDDTLTHERSLDFCRYLSCLRETRTPYLAAGRFLERWPHAVSRDVMTKAAVAPGTTTDGTWANPLIAVAPLVAGFLTIARSESLIGRIPNLRMVPFHVRIPILTQDANFAWVQQGTPKPVTKYAFDPGITLGPTKGVGIVIETDEFLRLTVPGMEGALRDELIRGLTAFTDRAFLDPTSTTIADTQPGSITSGLTPIAGTGDLPKDVAALVKSFYSARPGARDPVLLMRGGQAAELVGAAGTPGTAFNMPIVVTEAAGTNVIVIDPRGILVADAGVVVDVTKDATIEMVDNPAAPTAATIPTSLWQANLIGLRVERVLNWEAVPGAVQYTTGAA